jgi:ABC-2 type transport system permease protein
MTRAIAFRDLREHWRVLLAWAVTAAALISLQVSVYPTVRKSSAGLKDFIEQYPDVFKKVFRIQDYTSGPGYLGTELFSLMLPLVFIAVGASWGSGFTAEEEERGTADLLFTLPISRARVLLGKAGAAVGSLLLISAICVAALVPGVALADMSVASSRLLAGVLVCACLGVLFTGFSALLGAVIGRKGAALGISVGLALVLFVFYSLAPLVSSFDAILPYNPFQWTLGSNPLTEAFDVMLVVKPLGLAFVFIGAAIAVFNRRDLRQV